ncbi:MAG: ABC transporter ATP-binding protein/permease, partial [Cyanobacteria bacterium REEB65]|nr:ABC transporter ATP-binding protein/permease [Cyanobacteria bacterium REEB65]
MMFGQGQMGWHILNYGAKPERPQISKDKLRRIVRYFRPYWREACAILVVISISAFAGLVPPLLLRGVIDTAIPKHQAHLLALLVAGMIALPIVSGLLGIFETFLDERLSQGIMLDVRIDLFERLQRQSMDYFTDTRPGEISSRLNNDVNDLGDIFSDTVVAITSNTLTLVTTLGVLFSLNWRLALLAVAILPLFFPPAFWVGKLRQDVIVDAQKVRADLHAFVQDTMSINGFLMRRVFGSLPSEREQYLRHSQEFARVNIRRSLLWRWFTLVLQLFGIIGPAVIYGYGGWLAMGPEHLSIGTIVAFVAYLGRLYAPTSALANVHVDVMGAIAVFDRLFGVLDAEPTVQDRPGALAPWSAERPTRGRLVFHGVGFHYRSDRPLLEGISFEAEPGQLIALVGPSGAGKTTLTYLIARFYDPTDGSVLLDGYDLRDLALQNLQAQIGMVTQEPFLFHTSIRENLLIAKPAATQRDLEEACRSAYLHDVIAALPEGYDTVVGERGYRMSGGERQRLAL